METSDNKTVETRKKHYGKPSANVTKPRFALLNEAVPTKGHPPAFALTEINAADKSEFELIVGTTFVPNEFKEFHNVKVATTVTITTCKGMSEKMATNGIPIINIFANYGPEVVTVRSDDIGGPGLVTIKAGKSKQITIYPLKDGSFRLY